MIREVAKEYPNFKVIGNTLRDVITASINDWAPSSGTTAKSTCRATTTA